MRKYMVVLLIGVVCGSFFVLLSELYMSNGFSNTSTRRFVVPVNVRIRNDTSFEKSRTFVNKETIEKKTLLLSNVNESVNSIQAAFPGRTKKLKSYGERSKYLIYTAHNGFSNQMVAFGSAAIVASFTKRILVIPPVAPHKALRNTPCLIGGQKALVKESLKAYFEHAKDYGLLSSLFCWDFQWIWKNFKFQMMTWEEFTTKTKISNPEDLMWNTTRVQNIYLEKCERSDLKSLTNLGRKFKSKEILVLGSGFWSGVYFEVTHIANHNILAWNVKKTHRMMKFLMSSPIPGELNSWSEKLLTQQFNRTFHLTRNVKNGNFEGFDFAVHVRSGDMNQDAALVVQNATTQLKLQGATEKSIIFIATDILRGLRNPFFVDFLKQFPNSYDVDGIISLNPKYSMEFENLAMKLESTVSNLKIVMDQHFCATANRFLASKYRIGYASTFTIMINSRRSLFQSRAVGFNYSTCTFS